MRYNIVLKVTMDGVTPVPQIEPRAKRRKQYTDTHDKIEGPRRQTQSLVRITNRVRMVGMVGGWVAG